MESGNSDRCCGKVKITKLKAWGTTVGNPNYRNA